jgi:hypothetical protein
MNPRRWLLSHPVVLRSAALMQSADLGVDTICRVVEDALKADLPDDAERADVIRVLRRVLKHERGTIEGDGTGGT